jgi:hypothetical protein
MLPVIGLYIKLKFPSAVNDRYYSISKFYYSSTLILLYIPPVGGLPPYLLGFTPAILLFFYFPNPSIPSKALSNVPSFAPLSLLILPNFNYPLSPRFMSISSFPFLPIDLL